MQYFKLSGYSTYAFLTGYLSGGMVCLPCTEPIVTIFMKALTAYNVATDDDLVT
jgi:hypothetical protein